MSGEVRSFLSLGGEGWVLSFITFLNSFILSFLELYVNTVSIIFCYFSLLFKKLSFGDTNVAVPVVCFIYVSIVCFPF